MSIQKILTDPALQPLLFIPVVTLVLGIIGAVITQIILEGRQRHVITFSQKKEIPLTLAKDELKEKLQIEYQGSKIDTLYYFHLKIANTGKKMIEKQILACIFTEGSKSIDPAFPKISTLSPTPVKVGPINLISQQENTYTYQVEKISTGQIIDIDFLITSDKRCDLKLEFDALDRVRYQKGDISKAPTLGTHIERLAINLVCFFILLQMLTQLPYPFNGLGLISLPFIFLALRELHSIISILSIHSIDFRESHPVEVAGTGNTAIIGDSANITIHQRPQTDET